MPTTPEPPREPQRPRRPKPKLTDEALASRLAASLDPNTPAEPVSAEPMPKRIAAEPAETAETVRAEPVAPSQAAEPVAAPAAASLFSTGVNRLTGAVSSVQDMARDTAQSLADTRLKAAHSIVAFQKKLLEMVHANLNEGFAAAQKMVAAPTVGEAIRVQNSFAQTRVKALSDQAAELQTLSAQLAKEAQEPWAAHMTKSIERMKSGLSV